MGLKHFCFHSVPIIEKIKIPIKQKNGYYNLGLHKLRELTNDEHCPFVLWNGNKRLIKRKALCSFLFPNTAKE
ncbi:MAG: transposase [Clostridiales bacterium]|nr:transposase [Clostridiales bacterium]